MKFAPSILELPCDVLIPAALESQIHSGNAGNIKVPTVHNSIRFLHQLLLLLCIQQWHRWQILSFTNDLKNPYFSEFQAKIVAEAANGPVTPLAETILEDNDVVILPDLLLNAVSFSFHLEYESATVVFWSTGRL